MSRSRRSSVEELESCADEELKSTEQLPSSRRKFITAFAGLRTLTRLRLPSFARSTVIRRKEQTRTPRLRTLTSWRNTQLPLSQPTEAESRGAALSPGLEQTREPDQVEPASPETLADRQPCAIQHPDSHCRGTTTEPNQTLDNRADRAEIQSLASTLRPTELPEPSSDYSTPLQAYNNDHVNESGLSTPTEAGDHDLIRGSSTSVQDELSLRTERSLPSLVQLNLTDGSESISEASTALAHFQSFGERCYVAVSMEVDRKLLDIFDNGLRHRIGRALNHSRLEDDRISIECLMVGEAPSLSVMNPTIFFVCFTQAQKRTIVRAMNNLDFRADLFSYKVVIYRIVKACLLIQSQDMQNMIGCFVEVGIPPSSNPVCGMPARVLVDIEKGNIAKSTIGGFIMVNNILYALTTAHGFINGGEEDCEDRSKNVFQMEQPNTTETTRVFTRMGTVHSFEWTDKSNKINISNSCIDKSFQEARSQDWALIDVSLAQHLKCENSFLINGKSNRVQGYFPNKELLLGDVWVCSSSRGVLRGTLSGSTVSLMMGHSTFDARSVYLDHELVAGDSGSWVIRDGKLCGYIFCRVVGIPLAYMLPIEPVIQEIARVLANGVVGNVLILAEQINPILGPGSQIHVNVEPGESAVQLTKDDMSSGADTTSRELDQMSADAEIVSEVTQAGVSPWAKSYILSFDGGGVRGLSCVYLLKEVMLRIKDLERSMTPPAMSSFDPLPCLNNLSELVSVDGEGDTTESYLPCHYFDYIAGTSTGGLIAIMLSRLRMSIDDAINEFIDIVGKLYSKPRIFSMRGPIPWKRSRYDGELLDNVIKDLVARKLPPSHPPGDDKFKSNSELCKTMVIAYGKQLNNIKRETAYIFRSYPHYQHPNGKPQIRNAGAATSLDIDTVAQASIVAPSYFEPIEIDNWKFGDGGYGCNNPAAEAYFEVRALHNESHSAIALLVSLGTGSTDTLRFTDQKGFSERLRQYVNAGKVLASDKHGVSNHLRRITYGIEKSYYRLNAGQKLDHFKLDEWKVATESTAGTMETIRALTEDYIAQKEVHTWIDEIAHILVDNRRKRAKLETGMWEEALLGTRWRCEAPGCEESGKLFRRRELEKHLRSYHADQEENFPSLVLRGKTRLD